MDISSGIGRPAYSHGYNTRRHACCPSARCYACQPFWSTFPSLLMRTDRRLIKTKGLRHLHEHELLLRGPRANDSLGTTQREIRRCLHLEYRLQHLRGCLRWAHQHEHPLYQRYQRGRRRRYLSVHCRCYKPCGCQFSRITTCALLWLESCVHSVGGHPLPHVCDGISQRNSVQ